MTFTSTKESQAVISHYHTLLKHKAAADKAGDSAESDRLQQELDALGGIDRYQEASLFGESTEQNNSFNSSLWVTSILKKSFLPKNAKIRLLDVGALHNHYLGYHFDWLESIAIDLHPKDDTVKQADLIAFSDNDKFNVVVLSLVLNFEGDAKKRGEMLRKAAHLLHPAKESLLFIVLPLACVMNSRYFKHGLLVKILESMGLELNEHKMTKKLALYVFQHTGKIPSCDKGFPRKLVRGGKMRNNFAIVLEGHQEVKDEETKKRDRIAGSKRRNQQQSNNVSSRKKSKK